jgi:hypothetical protein
VNPAGAEEALAPRPETLPATQVHAMGKVKGKTLEPGKDGEFLGRWFERVRLISARSGFAA